MLKETPAADAMLERTLRVGSRDIHVAETGEGAPLLMLHGGGPGASGAPNFERNIPILSRHFRVIVPDLPGYGRSTKGIDRNDPFGDLAHTMLGLLDVLGVSRAHVLGNSLGGACALRMALDKPDAVDRLVLMGPGGIDTTRAPPTDGLNRLLDYYTGEGPTREKMATFLRQYLVYDGSRIPDSVVEARFRASTDPEVMANPPLVRPSGMPNMQALDFTRDDRLPQLPTPTLVLWGINDLVNRPSGGQSLQQSLPNCDLYLFSRTGHWVQWERPDEFNAVTIAFLSKPSPA